MAHNILYNTFTGLFFNNDLIIENMYKTEDVFDDFMNEFGVIIREILSKNSKPGYYSPSVIMDKGVCNKALAAADHSG